jgi:hypothetical protein
MKNRFSKAIAALFCVVSLGAAAQTKGSITASDSVIKQEKFDKVLWSGWSKVETEWTAAVFYPSLKTNAVKMNCKTCESVTMVVQLKVDALGHLVASKVIKENKCGTKFPPKMKTQWLNYFGGKYEFPPAFRNKVVQVTLGTGLKC